MGQWAFRIEGEGAHHSPEVAPGRRFEQDADVLAKQFVGKMKELGHKVTAATFSHVKGEDVEVEVLEGSPLDAPPGAMLNSPQAEAAKAAPKAKAPAEKKASKKGKK